MTLKEFAMKLNTIGRVIFDTRDTSPDKYEYYEFNNYVDALTWAFNNPKFSSRELDVIYTMVLDGEDIPTTWVTVK